MTPLEEANRKRLFWKVIAFGFLTTLAGAGYLLSTVLR